ncbi:MAG: S41 family peptidase [Candidatus Omnitrophota bacterium]
MKGEYMRKKILVFTIAAILIIGITASAQEATKKIRQDRSDLYKQIELFASALSLVRSDYVDEVSAKDIVYGALKGMLMSLDAHSQFMTPETYEDMRVDTEGKFGGLGIEITLKDGILTIITPIEDTPAYKAGIHAGDKIVRIDGESTRDITLTESVKKLRGAPNTTVELTILREDEKRIFDVEVTRGIIEIKSIKEASILEDGIAYIKLVEFQENTTKQLEKSLEELSAKNFDSLILDLRNNPGGLLDTSVDVAEIFLPRGRTVVSTKGRRESQNVVYTSKHKKPLLGFPMIVLVNKGSASASEIVAGAIKDNKRGIIVGETTFGKGSVQTVVPLADGSAVRITTAKYFTPGGREIHNKGIEPDVLVPFVRQAVKEAGDTDDVFDEYHIEDKKDKVEKDKDGEDKAEDAKKQDAGKEDKKDGQPREYDNQLKQAVDLIKGIKAYQALGAEANG